MRRLVSRDVCLFGMPMVEAKEAALFFSNFLFVGFCFSLSLESVSHGVRQSEVQASGVAASPTLPRPVASLLYSPSAVTLETPDWRRYSIAPVAISPERLAAQMELQGAGGMGFFALFDLEHHSFGIYQVAAVC